MRIAVLCSPDSWYCRDLRRAAEGRHDVTPLSFSQIESAIGTELQVGVHGEALLDGYDAVLVRTMPPGSLEQVVFRMDALGQLHANGMPVVNSPRAIEAAVDKYLSTALLQRAGLPTPRTVVCQTADQALQAFARLGGDVVLKPLFGSEGRGITRVSDEALMWRAAKMLSQIGAVAYLQEFVEHEGHDLRLLVIGQQVLGIRRTNRHDWRTNVNRGADASPLEPDEAQRHMALSAAQAVGAEVAGVDILPARDGRQLVLEVNAVPGWQALARARRTDVAALVLQHLERRLA